MWTITAQNMEMDEIMETNEIIKAGYLTKVFGDQKAVDNLSFTVYRGETLGLLGPNGAGKTTTIKMLIGLFKPTKGRAIIGGYDVRENPIEVKKLFGISPQELSFDHHLSIEEDLYFYARLYDLSRKEAKERVKETLKWAKLDNHAKKIGYQLSGGMQRRLFMARAMITDPPILFLDEPTTGLDPQSRHALWDYIFDLKGRGKTIILTTHYLEEAEMLCDRVIIIDYGKKIAEGTPDELKQNLKAEKILSITPKNSIGLRVIEEIKEFSGVENAIWHDGSLKIYLKDESVLELIVKQILENAGILEMDIKRASLEDVFLHLTGRELRE